MRHKTVDLISQLTNGIDVDRILEATGLTAIQALRLLTARPGKRQLAAQRGLAKIHADLVANRFSPYAVQRLCELLHSDKPELRLKGAIAVLSISGLNKQRVKRGGKTVVDKDAPENLTPAEYEVVEVLAEVMGRRIQAQLKPTEPPASGGL